jgi:hypothetical protein
MLRLFKEGPHLLAGAFVFLLGVLVVLLAYRQSGEASPPEDERPLPPLSYTFDSPESLAKEFLDALYRKDVDTLKTFALNKEEFRLHVWPELPVSQIKKPLPFDYGWADLHQKSINSLKRTYVRYGGRELTFIRLEFEDETTQYETYAVHRDARVVVRDEETGREMRLDLFGSIMEKNGRFKLFSYVTD